ncbi:fumarylacetoacetate hydrolase family protein, partial [Rhizobium ruizarguesonis]
LNQMICKVPEIIAELSKLFTLAPGDIIMTGTPAGVGGVAEADCRNDRRDGSGMFEGLADFQGTTELLCLAL